MLFALKNVSYTYNDPSNLALNEINTTFDSVKITGLIGENGSGKTTLIKILLRRLVDYSGNYSIDNNAMYDYTGSLAFNYGIGYSSDVPELDETLTGLEILEIVNELRGGSSNKFKDDLLVFKEYLSIGDWIKEKPCSEYSAGMRKKTSICIGFTGALKFVILDEPINGLDPLSILGLRKLLFYKKDTGTGILISSHILDFTEKIVDNILVLKKGTMIFEGKLFDLKNQFKNLSLEEIYFTLYRNSNNGDQVIR
jgi:ABC-type multidrug transport system ATPase subunit